MRSLDIESVGRVYFEFFWQRGLAVRPAHPSGTETIRTKCSRDPLQTVHPQISLGVEQSLSFGRSAVQYAGGNAEPRPRAEFPCP